MSSNVQLSGLELSLINEYGREVVLKQYIDEVRLYYDSFDIFKTDYLRAQMK